MTIPGHIGDWLSICELKARYCRTLDTKDWDAYRELFTEDYEMEITETGQPPIKGRDTALKFVLSFIEHAVTAHQVHMPEIALHGDEADAVWAMQDRVLFPNGAHLTGYGHYHEHYKKSDGRWRIARLKLTRLHVDIVQPDAAP